MEEEERMEPEAAAGEPPAVGLAVWEKEYVVASGTAVGLDNAIVEDLNGINGRLDLIILIILLVFIYQRVKKMWRGVKNG